MTKGDNTVQYFTVFICIISLTTVSFTFSDEGFLYTTACMKSMVGVVMDLASW